MRSVAKGEEARRPVQQFVASARPDGEDWLARPQPLTTVPPFGWSTWPDM